MTDAHTTAHTSTLKGRTRRHLLVIALIGCSSGLPFAALAAGPVNVDAQGVAVRGHDVVAYVVMGKPVKGSAEFSAAWRGATYWFSNAAHLQTFQADPARYEPQYGGYCAYGVAQGVKPDIDPTAFAVVDGKLFLNLNPGVQKRWQADIPGHIQRATQNWPTLKDQ